ncbi:aldose epimerase family protein [Pontibacter chitinilyticus]|uniref:aldose epimerase family protein n=1 Tax=Pontibacter chitinilyticus TaxID=2674989 RepID=UPI00321A5BFA
MKKRNTLLALALFGSLSMGSLVSCNSQETKKEDTAAVASTDTNMKIKKEPFGTTKDGQEVSLYTLTNKNGVQVKISDFGGIITSLMVPDKSGNMGDVVLGFDSISGYQSDAYAKSGPYFGALIGRYGNRIANGKFTLDGQEYTLAKNNGPNSLHGGTKGFDKVIWNVEPMEDQNALKLTYTSKDMEEGYPGNLQTTVVYTLTDDNELKIDYNATTDKATPLNLTNHSYFNLSAGKDNSILDDVLQINADKYTEVNETLIPTGKSPDVKGTPMDFTTPQTIGSRIGQVPGGYDHNYVLNGADGTMKLAATLYDPTSGRYMEVSTTQPGIQVYTGNFLDGTLTGKGDQKYTKNYAIALETQHFPDSPNQSSFPSTILKPGEQYKESTVYKFSTKDEAPAQAQAQ